MDGRGPRREDDENEPVELPEFFQDKTDVKCPNCGAKLTKGYIKKYVFGNNRLRKTFSGRKKRYGERGPFAHDAVMQELARQMTEKQLKGLADDSLNDKATKSDWAGDRERGNREKILTYETLNPFTWIKRGNYRDTVKCNSCSYELLVDDDYTLRKKLC